MPPDAPLPDADIALIDEWISAGATQRLRIRQPHHAKTPSLSPRRRRRDVRLRPRRLRVPAVPVQLRAPTSAASATTCPRAAGCCRRGGAARRRHDQHGRRRRLPARRGDAAVVDRAGDRPSPGGHAHRRRRPGVAAARACSRCSADFYARVAFTRRVFALSSRAALRGEVRPGGRRARRALHADPRTLHLARALPHVAPERDRPVRAAGALLRAVRHPLRRAHLLRPPLHRLRALQRDLQRVGWLRRGRVGAAPDRVHAAALQLPGRAAVGGRARIGRRRVLRDTGSATWRRWRRRCASASARR